MATLVAALVAVAFALVPQPGWAGGKFRGLVNGEAIALTAGPVFGRQPLDTWYGVARSEARLAPGSSHAKASLYDLNILDQETPVQRRAETDYPARDMPRNDEKTFAGFAEGPLRIAGGRFTSRSDPTPAASASFDFSAAGVAELVEMAAWRGSSTAGLFGGIPRSSSAVVVQDIRVDTAELRVAAIRSAVEIAPNGRGGLAGKASTEVVGATVGGYEVTIGPEGVQVAGAAVPLTQIAAAQEQVDALLAAAGIEVRALTGSVEIAPDGSRGSAEAPGLLILAAYSDERVQGGGVLQIAAARGSMAVEPALPTVVAGPSIVTLPRAGTPELERTEIPARQAPEPPVARAFVREVVSYSTVAGRPGRILWAPTGIVLGTTVIVGAMLFACRRRRPLSTLVAAVDRITLPIRRSALRG